MKVKRSHVVLNGMEDYTFKVVYLCQHRDKENFDLSVLFINLLFLLVFFF